MSAYYNEHDAPTAAWLRELVKAGLIADGEVDTRSIVDVSAGDVRGFAQCHFFAGIGGWSYALRLAGWSDDRRVWTGSCPCQPFSSAGAQAGGNDPRHLWPAWFRLIRERRPDVVFGEQVESAIRHGWLDLVCDDLEGEGYAVGAVGLPAACVGAPHIRQRLWFVAESESTGGRADAGTVRAGAIERLQDEERQDERRSFIETGRIVDSRAVGELGHASSAGLSEQRSERRTPRGTAGADAREAIIGAGASIGGMADSERGSTERRRHNMGSAAGSPEGPTQERQRLRDDARTGGEPFWSDYDWLPCRDGKARPVESGSFPLAYGVSARVGRLRGYGNAIVPQVAAAFIESYMSLGR